MINPKTPEVRLIQSACKASLETDARDLAYQCRLATRKIRLARERLAEESRLVKSQPSLEED